MASAQLVVVVALACAAVAHAGAPRDPAEHLKENVKSYQSVADEVEQERQHLHEAVAKAVPASAGKTVGPSPNLWKTHVPATQATATASAAVKSGDWAWGGEGGSGNAGQQKRSTNDANSDEVEKEHTYLHEAVQHASATEKTRHATTASRGAATAEQKAAPAHVAHERARAEAAPPSRHEATKMARRAAGHARASRQAAAQGEELGSHWYSDYKASKAHASHHAAAQGSSKTPDLSHFSDYTAGHAHAHARATASQHEQTGRGNHRASSPHLRHRHGRH